jgi:hypothetical protein
MKFQPNKFKPNNVVNIIGTTDFGKIAFGNKNLYFVEIEDKPGMWCYEDVLQKVTPEEIKVIEILFS